MSNFNYDVELLNSVASSGSMSYELTEDSKSYACDNCSGWCTGGCEGDCYGECKDSSRS